MDKFEREIVTEMIHFLLEGRAVTRQQLESIFSNWSQKPSYSEETKCENAERMIRDAINSDAALSRMSIHVIGQGSYKNKTNIKVNSDVDVCVKLTDVFYADYLNGITRASIGHSDASMSEKQFKNHVHNALVQKFGKGEVTRGRKSFAIKGNSYRIGSDVVACLEYRLYEAHNSYKSGIKFHSLDGTAVINWPEHHYQNAVYKNQLTSKKYKRTVRIFKNLTYAMQKDGHEVAKKMPSFLVECLVWNTPNTYLSESEYVDVVKNTLQHLYEHTTANEKCTQWREVNEIKYLFRDSQPWNRVDVNTFIVSAWNYLGFNT